MRSNRNLIFRLILAFGLVISSEAFTCSTPTVNQYVTSNLGSGCVALVRAKCSGLGGNRNTASWVRGIQVQTNCNSIPSGTAIATFAGPGNTYNGGSFKHAAIFAGGCKTTGFMVYDQWETSTGRKVGVNYRELRYSATGSNGGNNFYVIQ